MKEIEKLRKTVATLRGPGGCPWDQEQDHQSLAVCLLEECAELLETIDRLDYPHMREELGDVLLQVIFHAQLAEERGDFSLEEVAAEINEKLIRRHPHVFGDDNLADTGAVLKKWDEIKAAEKKAKGDTGPVGPFKDLPPLLPALLYAHDLYKQIAKAGLWSEDKPLKQEVIATAESLRDEEDLGRQLFILAAAARERGIDPESALRRFALQQRIDCE